MVGSGEKRELTMIKLYGHPVSTCTRKVLATLAETNTPYEFIVVDFAKGEHKQEPHLSRQPFGQVPAMDDEGFTLFESRAICRYLSTKAGNALTPAQPKEYAKMEQWLSVEQSNFSPNAMKFIFQYVFKRPQDEKVLEAAGQMVDEVYATLSSTLDKSPFAAGETFSLADIGYMPYIEYLSSTPMSATLQKYPSVAGWWERLRQRPSWKKVTGGA